MSDLPQLMRWSGPTAPPPQLPRVDPNTLTLMREHVINVHALAEITGIPSLYRWGRAIWERKPYEEVERDYFEHVFRQLQQLGASAPPPLGWRPRSSAALCRSTTFMRAGTGQ